MKFKLINLTLLGAIAIALASCGGNKENKPEEAPSVDSTEGTNNSEVKPGDSLIDGLGTIKIMPARHEYLKTDTINLDINAYSNDKLIKSSKIGYRLLDSNNEVIYEGTSSSNNNGLIKLNINLSQLSLKDTRYIIEVEGLITKSQIPSYFSFSIKDSINTNVVDYNALKAKGSFDNVIGTDPYTEDFIKSNALKGLGGFKLSNIDDREVAIDSIASIKPTVILFSTIGCASCKAFMSNLSRLDTSSLNIIYVTSGISIDELELAKEEARAKALKYSISEDNLYFDIVDSVWDEVLGYNMAPQMVFLNSYSEPISFMTTNDTNYDSFNGFKTEFNSVLNKAYGLESIEKVEYVNATIHYMDRIEVVEVKKGDTITLTPPSVEHYRFKGFKINDNYIDLDSYKINNNLDIYLDYQRVATTLDDIKGLDSVIIDLREEAQFNKGHLDNAINIPSKKFTNSFLDKNIKNDKTIILYGLDKPYEIMDYLEDKGYKSFYLIDYTIKDNEEIKYLTYEERKKNNEIDHYYDAHLESEVLKEHYAKSYLDLSFTGFDKKSHSLKDYLYLENKPTIIMVGSTTCITCEYTFDRFIEMEGSRNYNFVEAISFSKKEDLNTLIDKQLNRIDSSVLEMHKKYRFFDNNRYSKDNERFLGAHELPVFYILDQKGNLTNVVSSFDKARKYVDYLGSSISIKDNSTNPNREMSARINNGEYKHIENNEALYGLLEKSYARFLLKESYYDFMHNTKSINSFMDYNGFDKKKPLVLYVMNSANHDFNESITLLDNMMKRSDINLLAVVDNNSVRQTDLIMKPYSAKIMFDDYNYNISTDLILYPTSYFVILDKEGNLTNLVVDYSDLDKAYNSVLNTISIKSPNKLTKPSVIKSGDNVLTKDEAFTKKGFISHLDSVKDMARYEYLNINYGRNYLDFNVIDSSGSNVTLGSIIDPNKETIVCFLQSYMDDFYYAFNPLYKLKDRCNIVIIFTNRKDEPYNNEFVDNILRLGQEKAVAKAKEPQNIDGIRAIVKENNPTLSGEALDKAVDEYLLNKYDYLKMKEFIYGSYAYLTTPLLETEVRGIQLYLDKNGNLASISQTYYAVGGVFETVLNKIEGYIAKED